MRYTYDVFHGDTRLSTTTNFDAALAEVKASTDFLDIKVTDGFEPLSPQQTLRNDDDYLGWRDSLEKAHAWAHPNHSPAHYKAFIGDMEWIVAMSLTPQFRNPEVFKGSLLLMVNKYLDRLGMKDADVEEMRKAKVYLEMLIEYTETGKLTNR